MAEISLQRPTIRQGGTIPVRINMSPYLDEGDTISSATVAEVDTNDLTLSSVTVGSAEATILKETVAIGRWLQFTLSGHLAVTGTYQLKVTYTTAGGATDAVPRENYVLDVVA